MYQKMRFLKKAAPPFLCIGYKGGLEGKMRFFEKGGVQAGIEKVLKRTIFYHEK